MVYRNMSAMRVSLRVKMTHAWVPFLKNLCTSKLGISQRFGPIQSGPPSTQVPHTINTNSTSWYPIGLKLKQHTLIHEVRWCMYAYTYHIPWLPQSGMTPLTSFWALSKIFLSAQERHLPLFPKDPSSLVGYL